MIINYTNTLLQRARNSGETSCNLTVSYKRRKWTLGKFFLQQIAKDLFATKWAWGCSLLVVKKTYENTYFFDNCTFRGKRTSGLIEVDSAIQTSGARGSLGYNPLYKPKNTCGCYKIWARPLRTILRLGSSLQSPKLVLGRRSRKIPFPA